MGKPKILFMTSPEHGQANIHLAVIASLKHHHGEEVDIYLSSYDYFRPRVPEGVTFKPIYGRGVTTYYMTTNKDGGPLEKTYKYAPTRPGFFNAFGSIRKTLDLIHPETPEDYIKTAQAAAALMAELEPTLVVIDGMLDQARDAAMKRRQPHVLLSPNTLLENTVADQGLRAFTYPAFTTGYPWPVPPHLLLANALILLWTPIYLLLLSPNNRAKTAARRAAGFDWPLPLFGPPADPRPPTLCVSHRDVDYPCEAVGPHVVPCGPILQASRPLAEADPRLDAWVNGAHGRATVLVVLGSHMRLDEGDARSVFAGVRALLRARPDLQVLWKLLRFTEYVVPGVDDRGDGDEGEFGDRLRVVEWLEADPLAVLRTGRVAVFVDHGGSNSYHEGLASGVPQVTLSPWYDCHDFGNRAEWLGIGKWGNKSAAPKIDAAEFTNALLTVAGTDPKAPEALEFQKRARELSDVIAGRRKGGYDARTGRIEVGELVDTGSKTSEGRDIAADFIWEKVQEIKSAGK